MKRVIFKLATFVVALVVLFASCDKDVETSALELNKDKSATIKGYVYAELDLTRAGLEPAPAGTRIAIKINNNQFLAGVAGAYLDTAFLDANGSFSIVVPADDDGVNVSITPQPFEANQVQPFGTSVTPVMKIFTATPATVSVASGELRIQQISYAAIDFSNYVKMVEIKGKILANIDGNPGSEPISATVTLHTDTWALEVTSDASGDYSATVPANVIIKVTATFNRTVNGTPRNFEKKAANVAASGFAVDTEDVDIDFGDGTVVI